MENQGDGIHEQMCNVLRHLRLGLIYFITFGSVFSVGSYDAQIFLINTYAKND